MENLANLLRKLHSFLQAARTHIAPDHASNNKPRPTHDTPPAPSAASKNPVPASASSQHATASTPQRMGPVRHRYRMKGSNVTMEDRASILRLRTSIPSVPLIPGVLSYLALAHNNLLLPGVGQHTTGSVATGVSNGEGVGGGVVTGGQPCESASLLVSNLIGCWEECSPAELSHAPEATCLECLVLVLDNLLLLAAVIGMDMPSPVGALPSIVCQTA